MNCLRFLPLLLAVLPPIPALAQSITVLPEEIDRDCRGGRAALYDECGSQTKLFRQALFRAASEDKVLLVSFGAEWCIWCHVFEQYIKGEHTRLTYRFSDPGDSDTETVTLEERPTSDPAIEAARLRQYVAETFVLVHIEDFHTPDGYDVVVETGAHQAFRGGLPFIFTVDREGGYAAQLESADVETRRDGVFDWFRGYDRPALMAALDEMAQAAQLPSK